MIRIEIGPEPVVLAENWEQWGEEYAAALAAGTELPTRYRDESVKEALRQETHGKCAYCESHIEHVSFAHIEHILPKSRKPILVCFWPNLTLACPVCNTRKGSYYSVEAPLLDPYFDDVDDHITFYGPMAIHRSATAKLTIGRLTLNRPELLFRREQALREVLRILDLLLATSDDAAMQGALREDLTERLDEASEYAACARAFAQDECPRRGFGSVIHS